jgi:hypothetical protein
MVKTKLVEALITDAATILQELDRRNFPVEAMFWMLFPDRGYWRLVIGSPIVREEGGVAPYGQLGEWLREIDLAGVTLTDISMLDPESREFRSLFSHASASSQLAAGAAWLELDEAVVYRWTASAADGELTCDLSLSELNEIWQNERKTRHLKLPALLISQEMRRITLRIHPRHGTTESIEDAKVDFANALGRAHPDCQITWL